MSKPRPEILHVGISPFVAWPEMTLEQRQEALRRMTIEGALEGIEKEIARFRQQVPPLPSGDGSAKHFAAMTMRNVEMTKRHLERGDAARAAYFGLQTGMFYEHFVDKVRHEPDALRGEKNARSLNQAAGRANAEKKRQALHQAEKVCKLAEALWSKHPSLRKSYKRTAEILISRHDLGLSARTVCRYLDTLSKRV